MVVAKTKQTPTTKLSKKAATTAESKPTTTKTNTNKQSTNNKKSTVVEPVIEEPVKNNIHMKPIVPPHSIKINYHKKSIKAVVTLHKIPDKLINLVTSPTRFHLDTLKHSKKYLLDIPYPENVKVDDSKTECSFDRDVLTVFIPITSKLPANPKDTNKKRKSTQDDEDEEQEEVEQPKQVNKKQNKKQKVEPKVEEVEQEEEEEEEQEPIEEPIKTTQKKKKFINDESALNIMNEISDKQEKKATEKIVNEKKKNKQIESKVEEKQNKKQTAINRKENVLKKLKGEEDEQIKEEPVATAAPIVSEKPTTTKKSTKKVTAPADNANTDKSPKRVSFGEKVKVEVKAIPKVGKGLKLN